MKTCWPIWKPEIDKLLGSGYTASEILNLGDHLSDIFKSTGGTGRGQGELSAGGTAWESLVCWYINLCTVGSRIVAVKKMSLVPVPIRDAITVNYGNFACNTESDITILIFPDQPEYNEDVESVEVLDSKGVRLPTVVKGRLSNIVTDLLVGRHFTQFEIGVVQCKTNWNDNAQIPMLWDMIYSAGGFRKGRNITIGRNGFSIQACRNFTYSFVTVPSNQRTGFTPTSTSVKRVTNLSGGNYWGGVTQQNVARSLKEIFNNNFQVGFRRSLREDISAALPDLRSGTAFGYFGL
jgi:hypothetical protein